MKTILYKLPNRMWSITPNAESFIYTVNHGVIDGKLQQDETACKNLEDLNKKVAARIKKQIDINDYHYEIEKSKSRVAPMLAFDYRNVPHRLVFNGHIVTQAKLNGLRLTFGASHLHSPDEEKMCSRAGKDRYKITHLKEGLKELLNQARAICPEVLALDGEVYAHNTSLQKINSWAQVECENSLKLEYWVFDLIIQNMNFADRYDILKKLESQPGIKIVPNHDITNEKELYFQHESYIASNYEGTMIRDLKSYYTLGKRSPALFKYKDFEISKCKVISILKDKNDLDYYLLKSLDSGVVFEGVPAISHELRRDLSDKIGDIVLVKFQELSDKGVPIFPVVI